MTDGILVGCMIFAFGVGIAGIADLAYHLFRYAWRLKFAPETPETPDPRAGYTIARSGK